ncbi:hydrolase [Methylacidiphilum sp. Yel]|jgi:L-ascorbate metabolism protein UlaG (beta-lactamase superfamily)|uniref:metal-dependent hydrolase n=1 Tax=Methylacidiphilum sp. Yel TaxID=1847730 RepID=UPI00106D7220|nr:metal-dependent hydrolase [Methylacidiphilum sp. Yel]TFE67105.1 hydrolase [Methylacidiphilum sp. Yel]
MKIHYFGHSCFGLEVGSSYLLFDPFLTQNPMAHSIKVEDLHPHYILVSHGHFDHISDAAQLSKANQAPILSNFEITLWLEKQGVTQILPMNLGGSRSFNFGKIHFVQAAHSSSLPDGSYGGTAGGFIVESPEGIIYYAGDSAIISEMKLFGELFKIDIALLPIGGVFTMGIDEAIYAAKLLNCKQVMGVHFDTFDAIKIDHEEAKAKFQDEDIPFHLLKAGQALEI